VIQSREEFYKVYAALFERLKNDPSIGPEVVASDMVVAFTVPDLGARLTSDMTRKTWQGTVPKAGDGVIICGDTDVAPDVEITLNAEMMHQLWMGTINLIAALQQRQLTIKGPIPQITKLLPMLAPAYQIYPELLKEMGY